MEWARRNCIFLQKINDPLVLDLTQQANDMSIIGKEFEKPKTKPITIGNDCWIGKRSFLLKGTKLNDSCVVGAAAVVSNMVVTTGKSCVGNPAVLIN